MTLTKASATLALVAVTGILLAGCSVQPVATDAATGASTYTLQDNPLRGKTLTGTFQPDWGLPLAAFNDQNVPQGIVYDVVAAAAEKLGATLKLQPNAFATTIPGVQSGKYDVGLGTDATLERQAVVDIVGTYTTGYQFVTVTGHNDLPDSLEKFSGLKVAVIAGSSYIPPIEAASAKLVAAGKPAIDILTFPDSASTVVAVQSGRADGLLRYAASALYIAKSDVGWKISGPSIVLGESGFAVSKASGYAGLWKQAVDATIADGSYLEILKKYGVQDIAIDTASVNFAQ